MAELILYQKKSSLTLGISGSYFTKRMHMVKGCIVTLNKVCRSRSTKNHFSFREHVYPSLTPISVILHITRVYLVVQWAWTKFQDQR